MISWTGVVVHCRKWCGWWQTEKSGEGSSLASTAHKGQELRKRRRRRRRGHSGGYALSIEWGTFYDITATSCYCPMLTDSRTGCELSSSESTADVVRTLGLWVAAKNIWFTTWYFHRGGAAGTFCHWQHQTTTDRFVSSSWAVSLYEKLSKVSKVNI